MIVDLHGTDSKKKLQKRCYPFLSKQQQPPVKYLAIKVWLFFLTCRDCGEGHHLCTCGVTDFSPETGFSAVRTADGLFWTSSLTCDSDIVLVHLSKTPAAKGAKPLLIFQYWHKYTDLHYMDIHILTAWQRKSCPWQLLVKQVILLNGNMASTIHFWGLFCVVISRVLVWPVLGNCFNLATTCSLCWTALEALGI